MSATFILPTSAPAEAVDVAVTFPAPPDRGGNLVFTSNGVFTVR